MGVFVDPEMDYIKKFIKNNIIDIVQLHGNEDEEFVLKLKELNVNISIIKVIEVNESDNKFIKDVEN